MIRNEEILEAKTYANIAEPSTYQKRFMIRMLKKLLGTKKDVFELDDEDFETAAKLSAEYFKSSTLQKRIL